MSDGGKLETVVDNAGIPGSEWTILTAGCRPYAHLEDGRYRELLVPGNKSESNEQAHAYAVRMMKRADFCRMMWNLVNEEQPRG